MELIIKDAAQLLGVSQTEVRRLARQGHLEGRRLGRQWVVDAGDVQRRRRSAVARGRIWSHRTALAALTLLGGGDASDLVSASERSRLRKTIRGLQSADLQRLMSGLVTTQRLHVGAAGMQWLKTQVAAGEAAFLCGESALATLDRNLLGGERAEHGAQLELACSAADVGLLLEGSKARQAKSSVNVVLHVVQLATRDQLRSTGVRDTLTALSLGQHADARVRASARTSLASTLQQLQVASGLARI